MLLYGRISVDIYAPEIHEEAGDSSVRMWQLLAGKGILPALTNRVPDRLLLDFDDEAWFGRSGEEAVAGTFFIWNLETTFNGFEAHIAFQPDDESWTPSLEEDWAETGLIPNLGRWICGVRFTVNNDSAYINLRLT